MFNVAAFAGLAKGSPLFTEGCVMIVYNLILNCQGSQ